MVGPFEVGVGLERLSEVVDVGVGYVDGVSYVVRGGEGRVVTPLDLYVRCGTQDELVMNVWVVHYGHCVG